MDPTASTTYCMGYWPVPENGKYPLSHYLTLIPETIAMLAGERLLLFTDDARVQQLVANLCAKYAVSVLFSLRRTAELPAVEFARRILGQTESFGAGQQRPGVFNAEKGLLHYWRDFIDGGAENYLKVLSIWLSKVFLVNEVAADNPLGCAQFAWVDASIARLNGQRPGWNFARLPSYPRRVAHYRSRMRKHGRPLSLSAGFLKGDPQAWSSLAEVYARELELAAGEPYPNDEETILHSVRDKNPDLFAYVD